MATCASWIGQLSDDPTRVRVETGGGGHGGAGAWASWEEGNPWWVVQAKGLSRTKVS